MHWRRELDRMVDETEAAPDPWEAAADVVLAELEAREAERAIDAPFLELSVAARLCLLVIAESGAMSASKSGMATNRLGLDIDYVAGIAELYRGGWIGVRAWLADEDSPWPPVPRIAVIRTVDVDRLWKLVRADLDRASGSTSEG